MCLRLSVTRLLAPSIACPNGSDILQKFKQYAMNLEIYWHTQAVLHIQYFLEVKIVQDNNNFRSEQAVRLFQNLESSIEAA